MHCPWQHLKPGKVLTPHEVEDMDPILAGYAARNKLERVAAFRQLQGYSNQMKLMTSDTESEDPPKTLASLKLPDIFHVRPVKQTESRKTVRGAHEDVSFIVNIETRVRTPILPPDRNIYVPLLTLQLDQGAIGCAGAAFCMFHLVNILLF